MLRIFFSLKYLFQGWLFMPNRIDDGAKIGNKHEKYIVL